MLEKIEEMQNINFEYLIMINFNVAVLPSCRHLKEGVFKQGNEMIKSTHC